MIEVLRRMKERNTPNEPEFQPFDISNVENDIADIVRHTAYAPPAVRQALVPLPSYVQHAESADEISKLTAHAVISQYEECAKAIEQMREPLKAWAEGHQNALNDLHAAMKYVDEAAQYCRDLGAGTFERFQKSADVIAQVRRTCDELRAKIEPED